MAFNPDKYLEEKLGNKSSDFDPDKYLMEKENGPIHDPYDVQPGLINKNYIEPSFLESTGAAAQDIVGAIGSMADYPAGIMRQGVASGIDYVSGKKTGEEALDEIGNSIGGEAISSQDLAKKIPGVSDKPMGKEGGFKPFGDIPQSAIVGAAIDLLTSVPEAELLGATSKALAKGTRSLLNPEEMALKATGIRAKQLKDMLQGAETEPFKKMEEVSNYAQNNIITPLSGPEKMLQVTRNKLDSVGKRIGELRKNNEQEIEKWILKNPNNPEVKDYMDNIFNPEIQMNKISSNIDENIASPRAAQQVKSIVNDELAALQKQYPNTAVPIEKLSKLKTEWQNEINYGKEASDYSIREMAFKQLQVAADSSIENELKYGDKYLNNKSLKEHRDLKKEYSQLKTIDSGLVGRISKQTSADRGLIHNIITPVTNRITSSIASIPEVGDLNLVPNYRTGIGAGIIESGNLSNMRSGEDKEPMIEGFPASQTQQIDTMSGLLYGKTLDNDNSIPNVEKSRRMQLLTKHGRIYIGR